MKVELIGGLLDGTISNIARNASTYTLRKPVSDTIHETIHECTCPDCVVRPVDIIVRQTPSRWSFAIACEVLNVHNWSSMDGGTLEDAVLAATIMVASRRIGCDGQFTAQAKQEAAQWMLDYAAGIVWADAVELIAE